MSSHTTEIRETPAATPSQTMKGRTNWVKGVVHRVAWRTTHRYIRLSSIFRPQPYTNEEIELPQHPRRLQVVEVAAVRDRQVLYIAPRPRPDHPHTQPAGAAVPGTTAALSRLLRFLAHDVLFLCCASRQYTNGNGQPTHQGRVQAQPSSSQTHPAAASTFATPTAPDPRTIVPGAANVQPRPLPLRTHFVLFVCCASPPYADGR
ncbi:hypothetical protein EV702DRAFT_1204269 [Suillus placidus]|uniref:Uncharacterized protein n=1 Tax=Suillus placidus TaxID=48579 RepID=A0A9P6ZHT6_9AGAM|nr:hypothetical protein EV702DRAFT_1204269 [Suillus placidus]